MKSEASAQRKKKQHGRVESGDKAKKKIKKVKSTFF